SFSLPSNRYFHRQSFPPAGETYRYRPPLSARRYGRSFGFALRIFNSVKAIESSRKYPQILENTPRFARGRERALKVPPELPPEPSGFSGRSQDDCGQVF